VNALFELGQLAAVSQTLAAALRPIPVLGSWLAGYFLRGSFDPGDIAASALGSLSAAAVVHLFVLETPHAPIRG
jgi:hypothetical protein